MTQNGRNHRTCRINCHQSADERLAEKEDEADYQLCDDNVTGHFLNGLIIFRRGKDESRPVPAVDARLTNNIILKNCALRLN